MRLFFALWPDDAVRAKLVRWSQDLHDACGGRQTRAENLHITLAFLGDVDEARVADVERAADPVAPPSASLLLDEPGYWKRNRIAWAGASAVPRELETFVADLRGALLRAGIAFDDGKDFVSHVTLVRNARPPKTMPELPAIEWRLDRFALVRSVTLPQGSRYEIRKSWRA